MPVRERERHRDLCWSPREWPYFRYRRAFAPDPNYTVKMGARGEDEKEVQLRKGVGDGG